MIEPRIERGVNAFVGAAANAQPAYAKAPAWQAPNVQRPMKLSTINSQLSTCGANWY